MPGAGDHGRSPPPVVKCVICVGGDLFSIPDLPGMTTGATTDPFRESSYGCEHTRSPLPAPTSPSAAAESTSSPVRRTMVSIHGGDEGGKGEEGDEEGKEGGAPRNVEVVEVVWKVAGGNVVGGGNEEGPTAVFRAIEYVIDRHMRQERCDGSVVMLYRRSEGHAAVALTIAVVCKQIARMRRWYLLHSPEYVDPDLSALDKSSLSGNESYCFARHARLQMIEASSIIRLEVSTPPPPPSLSLIPPRVFMRAVILTSPHLNSHTTVHTYSHTRVDALICVLLCGAPAKSSEYAIHIMLTLVAPPSFPHPPRLPLLAPLPRHTIQRTEFLLPAGVGGSPQHAVSPREHAIRNKKGARVSKIRTASYMAQIDRFGTLEQRSAVVGALRGSLPHLRRLGPYYNQVRLLYPATPVRDNTSSHHTTLLLPTHVDCSLAHPFTSFSIRSLRSQLIIHLRYLYGPSKAHANAYAHNNVHTGAPVGGINVEHEGEGKSGHDPAGSDGNHFFKDSSWGVLEDLVQPNSVDICHRYYLNHLISDEFKLSPEVEEGKPSPKMTLRGISKVLVALGRKRGGSSEEGPAAANEAKKKARPKNASLGSFGRSVKNLKTLARVVSGDKKKSKTERDRGKLTAIASSFSSGITSAKEVGVEGGGGQAPAPSVPRAGDCERKGGGDDSSSGSDSDADLDSEDDTDLENALEHSKLFVEAARYFAAVLFRAEDHMANWLGPDYHTEVLGMLGNRRHHHSATVAPEGGASNAALPLRTDYSAVHWVMTSLFERMSVPVKVRPSRVEATVNKAHALFTASRQTSTRPLRGPEGTPHVRPYHARISRAGTPPTDHGGGGRHGRPPCTRSTTTSNAHSRPPSALLGLSTFTLPSPTSGGGCATLPTSTKRPQWVPPHLSQRLASKGRALKSCLSCEWPWRPPMSL